MTKFTTIKTSEKAKALLRLVAALTGEKMYAAMERLFSTEATRLQTKQKRNQP